MNQPTVYGIPHCDTVKKARRWLEQHGVAHRFHDFKTQGVPPDRLARWIDAVGWQVLVNRRGTTWRRLPAHEQAAIVDAASALAALQAHPSLIKRPVLEAAGQVVVGYDEAAYALLKP